MENFFEPYLSDIAVFIGLPVKVSLNEVDSTFSLTVDTSALFTTAPKIPFINYISALCSRALTAYYQEYSGLSDPFIHRQLLIPYLAFYCLGWANSDGQAFMAQLVQLAQATYESSPTQTGLLLVPEEFDLEKFVERLDLEYRPLDRSVALDTLLTQKSGWHLNDAQSSALVISRTLNPLGWIFKRQRAIREVMIERFTDFDAAVGWVLIHEKWLAPVLEQAETGVNDEIDVYQKVREQILTELRSDVVTILSEVTEGLKDPEDLAQLMDTDPEDLAQFTATIAQRRDLNPETRSSVILMFERANSALVDVIKPLSTLNDRRRELHDIFQRTQAALQARTVSVAETVEMFIPMFVYLDRGRVCWVLEDGLELVWDHGRWHFIQHHLLRHIILTFFLKVQSSTSVDDLLPSGDRMLRVTHSLVRAIVDAAAQRHGALVILLPTAEAPTYGPPQFYESFVTNEDGDPVSVADIDRYRLRLLLALDGAVVLDSHGNVRSFGHMVNLKKSESLESHGQGARSLAAQEASRAKATISIKVSEDGDIAVFSQEKQVARV